MYVAEVSGIEKVVRLGEAVNLMIDQQNSSVLAPGELELFQRRQDYEGSGSR